MLMLNAIQLCPELEPLFKKGHLAFENGCPRFKHEQVTLEEKLKKVGWITSSDNQSPIISKITELGV